MAIEKNVGGFDRIARTVLAVALAMTALRALRSGRRSVGALAAVGAVGLGFNAVSCFCGMNRVLGIDTTAESE